MIKTKSKKSLQKIRHKRTTKKIKGTAECPRLVVYKSLRNIYVQLVDDKNKKVITGCSSLTEGLKDKKCNIKSAKAVGEKIAEIAKAKGIEKIVFDRSGYIYHGIIKALADAARKGGLIF